MNPSTSTAAAPSSLLHDVLPPAPKAPVNPVVTASPVKAEVVESIPVKSPGVFTSAQPAHQMMAPNPIAVAVEHPQAAGPVAAKGDKDLDRILRTVNRNLKVSDAYEQKQANQKKIPGLKLGAKSALPAAAAVIVAGVLMFFAVSTFRHPTTAVRTRATAGSLISPSNR